MSLCSEELNVPPTTTSAPNPNDISDYDMNLVENEAGMEGRPPQNFFPPRQTFFTATLLFSCLKLAQILVIFITKEDELVAIANNYRPNNGKEHISSAWRYCQGLFLDHYFALCRGPNNLGMPNPLTDFDTVNNIIPYSSLDILATHKTDVGIEAPPLFGGFMVPFDGFEATARFGLIEAWGSPYYFGTYFAPESIIYLIKTTPNPYRS